MPAPQTFDASQLHSAIERIAAAIEAAHGKSPDLCLAGIANGGIELTRRLGERLNVRTIQLNPLFHRDDIGRNPIPKETEPSIIPFDVTGLLVIIVDDVLHSGRTMKAALDELFDWGRPDAVELAILVDRGGHKLPFDPTFCGVTVGANHGEKVVVRLDPNNPARDQATITPANL